MCKSSGQQVLSFGNKNQTIKPRRVNTQQSDRCPAGLNKTPGALLTDLPYPLNAPRGFSISMKLAYLAAVDWCENALAVGTLDLSILWLRNAAERKAGQEAY